MMSRTRIIAWLLRLYPAAWRSEYGAEFVDMLAARPLTMGVIADVLRAGVLQRLRAAEPSTILGVVAIVGLVSGLEWPPLRHVGAWASLVRPSGKAVPEFTITLISSAIYALLLVACGCWTQRKSCASRLQCGIAAMRMSLIATAPIVLAGLLMATGVIQLPGDGRPTTVPYAFVMMTSPLFALPGAWLWGAVGGQLGQWIGWARRAMVQP